MQLRKLSIIEYFLVQEGILKENMSEQNFDTFQQCLGAAKRFYTAITCSSVKDFTLLLHAAVYF